MQNSATFTLMNFTAGPASVSSWATKYTNSDEICHASVVRGSTLASMLNLSNCPWSEGGGWWVQERV